MTDLSPAGRYNHATAISEISASLSRMTAHLQELRANNIADGERMFLVAESIQHIHMRLQHLAVEGPTWSYETHPAVVMGVAAAEMAQKEVPRSLREIRRSSFESRQLRQARQPPTGILVAESVGNDSTTRAHRVSTPAKSPQGPRAQSPAPAPTATAANTGAGAKASESPTQTSGGLFGISFGGFPFLGSTLYKSPPKQTTIPPTKPTYVQPSLRTPPFVVGPHSPPMPSDSRTSVSEAPSKPENHAAANSAAVTKGDQGIGVSGRGGRCGGRRATPAPRVKVKQDAPASQEPGLTRTTRAHTASCEPSLSIKMDPVAWQAFKKEPYNDNYDETDVTDIYPVEGSSTGSSSSSSTIDVNACKDNNSRHPIKQERILPRKPSILGCKKLERGVDTEVKGLGVKGKNDKDLFSEYDPDNRHDDNNRAIVISSSNNENSINNNRRSKRTTQQEPSISVVEQENPAPLNAHTMQSRAAKRAHTVSREPSAAPVVIKREHPHDDDDDDEEGTVEKYDLAEGQDSNVVVVISSSSIHMSKDDERKNPSRKKARITPGPTPVPTVATARRSPSKRPVATRTPTPAAGELRERGTTPATVAAVAAEIGNGTATGAVQTPTPKKKKPRRKTVASSPVTRVTRSAMRTAGVKR